MIRYLRAISGRCAARKGHPPRLWRAAAGLIVGCGLAIGTASHAQVVSTGETNGFAGDLGAARFVVVDVGSTGSDAPFEVWVDGMRKVRGLRSGVPSPYLLLAPGERTLEVRQGPAVWMRTVRPVRARSSTTFLMANNEERAHLVEVADSPEGESRPTVRVVNLTAVSRKVQFDETSLDVPPSAISEPALLATDLNDPGVRVEGRDVRVDRREPGSKLLLIVGAGPSGGRESISMFSSVRYPSSLLAAGDVAKAGSVGREGHAPEFWIRRLLSACVVALVVATTITTLHSFRAQALHSRVRARME